MEKLELVCIPLQPPNYKAAEGLKWHASLDATYKNLTFNLLFVDKLRAVLLSPCCRAPLGHLTAGGAYYECILCEQATCFPSSLKLSWSASFFDTKLLDEQLVHWLEQTSDVLTAALDGPVLAADLLTIDSELSYFPTDVSFERGQELFIEKLSRLELAIDVEVQRFHAAD